MTPLEHSVAFAADFELTYVDDDWERLRAYFAIDAVYEVSGVSFSCELRGPNAILNALRKSVDGFDRRFDSRTIELEGIPTVEGNRVIAKATIRYSKEGVGGWAMKMTEILEWNGERITRIHDVYDSGQEEAEIWLEQHAADFNVGYV